MKTTYYAKPGEVEREWLLIDAAEGKNGGMILGRLAAQVAAILRGKHKPTFTPHVDTGDFVVIVNADKVRLSGNKEEEKVWYRYTGYIGGLKKETWKEAMEKHPERIVERAVKGMLPRPQAVHQAQGVRWPRASPPGPEPSQDFRGGVTDEQRSHLLGHRPS